MTGPHPLICAVESERQGVPDTEIGVITQEAPTPGAQELLEGEAGREGPQEAEGLLKEAVQCLKLHGE